MIGAFAPQGKSFLVDSSAAVQVLGTSSGQCVYRIRSKNASEAYLFYSQTSTVPSTAPIVGTSATGAIGMSGLITETFTLPPNCYFQAQSGATFEIIPGDGV